MNAPVHPPVAMPPPAGIERPASNAPTRFVLNWLRAAFDRATWPVSSALLLLMLAVGTPHLLLSRDTYRYMVTFDVTQSMDVEDLQLNGLPVSRLALARAAAHEALLALPCGSEIGWSLFADYRVLVLLLPVEVCGHYEELLASLDQIDGRMRWANASNIGKGVTWALRTAKQMEPHTHVIFLTDGQEAPPLREPGLPVMADITPGEIGGWLIGVGGEVAVRIPKTDSNGNPAGFWTADEVVQRPGVGQGIEHLSRREDDYLQSLAVGMGLGYAPLTDPGVLKRAMLDSQLAWRQPVETDLRWLPAGLALLLLVWRFRPERRRPVNGLHRT
ncbi:MxaL protein [Ideonella azotifigens]|uniref:MxaL protein n=1 Tax=Ideonella azotifigens TaxID=513160 RepID=A0ABN1KG00_9BURK|nr:MxaL protein [Ideonella azotifigens]MCD2340465.1 MxaL protein [Ideonella azotifigens]